MFPSSIQHASLLDRARAAAQEDEISHSFRDVLSVLADSPPVPSSKGVQKSLLSSKLNRASACSSCAQVSEDHIAEVVIVSEPEGTSLHMGGYVGDSFEVHPCINLSIDPFLFPLTVRTDPWLQVAPSGVSVRETGEYDASAGRTCRVQTFDERKWGPRSDRTGHPGARRRKGTRHKCPALGPHQSLTDRSPVAHQSLTNRSHST